MTRTRESNDSALLDPEDITRDSLDERCVRLIWADRLEIHLALQDDFDLLDRLGMEGMR